MARGPGHRPLILLRWILLGLLLISAAAVLRVYLGRDTTPAKPRSLPDGVESATEGADEVLRAEGFEYEVIDEGVTLFFIRSDSMVADRQDRFILEGVELRMEDDESGDLYTVASDRAIYDLESRDASLEGSVRMTGPDGLELSGEAFDLRRGGRILESTAAPVGFRVPGGYSGSAREVRINLNLNNLVLRGGVTVVSPPGQEPPVRLTATTMLYREEEALLRSEGGVVFSRGGDRLSCERLSVSFAPRAEGEGLGEVRFIQGRWQVRGRLALDARADRAGQLAFEAEKMGVTFEAGGDRVESVVLEGGEEEEAAAVLRFDDGTGLRQTLRSASVFTSFRGGEISRLETYQPAILEESLAAAGAAPMRRLCGDTLSARIDGAGRLDDLLLDGSVDYRDSRMSAAGYRLEGDPENELRLTGTPARLRADTDDVEAPEIVYSRRDGTLLATGGVRAAGLDRSGVELAAGDARDPVLVTADQARWTEEPPEVVFQGSVRAWQGESFLLAGQLRVLEDGGRLEGEGAVKTVWAPRPEEESERAPIEINAQEMVYLRQERQLNYRRSVRAHEAGRTVRCDELELLLDPERKIDSLLCEGQVVIEDPVNGRTVRGSEALYTPNDRLVLITGAPVVLKQRDGAEMEGRRLRYNLDTGQVRILSEPRTAGPEAELVGSGEPADG